MSGRAIVVGSGVGGLGAAAALSRGGFEVRVLERSESIGGLLNPFRRGEYEFCPGVHYVGQCREGQAMHEILDDLGIDASEVFAELDPDGFDVYRFPDLQISMCAGMDRYRDRLCEAFPDECGGIDRIFDAVHHLEALSEIRVPGHTIHLRELPEMFSALSLLPLMNRNFGEYLELHVESPELRAVLAAQGGDYALPPHRAPALIGIGILAHYVNGAFFPKGGSGALRDALQSAAEEHGASFRTGAEVVEILVERGDVAGVRTADGEVERADVVVADVDPRHVFGHLLPPDVVPHRQVHRAKRMESSLSALLLHLGLSRDLRARGIGRQNIWTFPTFDIDAMYQPIFDGELPERPGLFVSPTSIKDPTGKLAPAGGTSLEIMTFAPYSMFAKWSHGHRDRELDETKDRLTRWLLDEMERQFPGVVGDVEVAELSTPLAFEHYVAAVEGGLYGPAVTADQSLSHRFAPTTFIPNLYLAGAGVFGMGVMPSLMSGVVAARIALKKSKRSRWRAKVS